MPDATDLYKSLRTRAVLHGAWSVVRDNGLRSTSSETRGEVKAYSANIFQNLDKIQHRLRKNKFEFLPAKGILIKKRNKASERPVVIAPVSSRIVQRAMLDVIQKIPQIRAELQAGFNFGGVEGKEFGVPSAVKKAHITSQNSAYYIRTDIKSFFTAVPRQRALAKILQHSKDPLFNKLLEYASNTELQDLASFGDKIKLFPLAEEGVAQGSCLSPLLCNFLLSDFDREMNDRGIVCIRYIDDYIMFGPDKRKTLAAFKSSLKKLYELGLDAYDPFSETERLKADHGVVENGFTFLGCDVTPTTIRPATSNRKKLLQKISSIFNASLIATHNPSFSIQTDNNFIDAVSLATGIVKGWGNTYSFCTDQRLNVSIDIELGKLFSYYEVQFEKIISKYSEIDRRRAHGFFPLIDCNCDSPT